MLQLDTKNIDTPIESIDSESDGDKLTIESMVKATDRLYKNLLDSGYHLKEIDEMDIFYYLYLISLEDYKEEIKKVVYIDDIVW